MSLDAERRPAGNGTANQQNDDQAGQQEQRSADEALMALAEQEFAAVLGSLAIWRDGPEWSIGPVDDPVALFIAGFTLSVLQANAGLRDYFDLQLAACTPPVGTAPALRLLDHVEALLTTCEFAREQGRAPWTAPETTPGATS